jgi:ankyrin repeat protein
MDVEWPEEVSISKIVPAVTEKWKASVKEAVIRGQLALLRELSWSMSNSMTIRNLLFDYGDTCLHLAAKHGHIEMIYWLASQTGCDPLARNANNQTPRNVADSDQVVHLLDRLVVGS